MASIQGGGNSTVSSRPAATRIGRALGRRWGLARKSVSRHVRRPHRAESPVLLIVGCQRSGTTALQNAFDADPDIAVFGELGFAFTRERSNHRLRSVPTVRRQFAVSAASLNVVKPLVESHRVIELLDALPGSRAIWMYRQYDDVAGSNLRRFGDDNGRRNLTRAIWGQPGDWRYDGAYDEDRAVLAEVLNDELADPDAAALFWWLRNRLFFRQRLVGDDRVRLCSYDDLTSDPAGTIGAMYEFVGLAPPADAGREIHRRSVRREAGLELAPRVVELCEPMLADLETTNAASGLLATR